MSTTLKSTLEVIKLIVKHFVFLWKEGCSDIQGQNSFRWNLTLAFFWARHIRFKSDVYVKSSSLRTKSNVLFGYWQRAVKINGISQIYKYFWKVHLIDLYLEILFGASNQITNKECFVKKFKYFLEAIGLLSKFCTQFILFIVNQNKYLFYWKSDSCQRVIVYKTEFKLKAVSQFSNLHKTKNKLKSKIKTCGWQS